MTIKRIGAGANLSRAVEHGGVVYLAGLTADDKSAGMAEQTRQVLARIDALLAEAGTNKSHLLSAMIYLSDMSKRDEMNKQWQAWVDPANPPARATVGAELGSSTTLVEIMVTAAKP